MSRLIMGDPVEKTPEYKSIEKELEATIEEILEKRYPDRPFGLCHVYWGLKKDILKKKYGIEWKSPQELNPHVIFD